MYKKSEAMVNMAPQQETVSFGADGDLAEKHPLYILHQKIWQKAT